MRWAAVELCSNVLPTGNPGIAKAVNGVQHDCCQLSARDALHGAPLPFLGRFTFSAFKLSSTSLPRQELVSLHRVVHKLHAYDPNQFSHPVSSQPALDFHTCAVHYDCM